MIRNYCGRDDCSPCTCPSEVGCSSSMQLAAAHSGLQHAAEGLSRYARCRNTLRFMSRGSICCVPVFSTCAGVRANFRLSTSERRSRSRFSAPQNHHQFPVSSFPTFPEIQTSSKHRQAAPAIEQHKIMQRRVLAALATRLLYTSRTPASFLSLLLRLTQMRRATQAFAAQASPAVMLVCFPTFHSLIRGFCCVCRRSIALVARARLNGVMSSRIQVPGTGFGQGCSHGGFIFHSRRCFTSSARAGLCGSPENAAFVPNCT